MEGFSWYINSKNYWRCAIAMFDERRVTSPRSAEDAELDAKPGAQQDHGVSGQGQGPNIQFHRDKKDEPLIFGHPISEKRIWGTLHVVFPFLFFRIGSHGILSSGTRRVEMTPESNEWILHQWEGHYHKNSTFI